MEFTGVLRVLFLRKYSFLPVLPAENALSSSIRNNGSSGKKLQLYGYWETHGFLPSSSGKCLEYSEDYSVDWSFFLKFQVIDFRLFSTPHVTPGVDHCVFGAQKS